MRLSRILTEVAKQPEIVTGTAREINKASLYEYDADIALQITLPLQEAPWSFKWDLLKPSRLVQRSIEVSPAMRRMFAISAIISALGHICEDWAPPQIPTSRGAHNH